MKFFLFINVTIVGILTFMSRKISILGLFVPEKAEFLDIFILTSFLDFMLYCMKIFWNNHNIGDPMWIHAYIREKRPNLVCN